jgi:hypothetical protein
MIERLGISRDYTFFHPVTFSFLNLLRKMCTIEVPFRSTLRLINRENAIPEKGKPIARWGRKVMDPALAGPPDCRRMLFLSAFLFKAQSFHGKEVLREKAIRQGLVTSTNIYIAYSEDT